jgi:hypothetical protein
MRLDSADLCDLAILDSNVVAETRCERSVHDHPVFDY